MISVACTESQLGMLVVRANWVNRFRRAHLKVNTLAKDPAFTALSVSLSCLSSLHCCSWEYQCNTQCRIWYFTVPYWGMQFRSLDWWVHVAIIFMVYTSVQVDIACTSKIPSFFLITLRIPGGKVSNITHQPGQRVSDFHITIPQNVRHVCTFHVKIRAGNSAGMSSPNHLVKHGELNCSSMLLPIFLTYINVFYSLFRWQSQDYWYYNWKCWQQAAKLQWYNV